MITIDGGTGIITSNNRLQLPANSGGSGNIIQVVQNVINGTRAETVSTTYVATDKSVTITPKIASSKILLQFNGEVNTNGSNARLFVTIYRSIASGTFANIAPVGSSQTVGSDSNNGFLGEVRADNSRLQVPFSTTYLDSPTYSVGQAIEYKLYMKSANTSTNVEMPSSSNAQPIIAMAMEIAA